MVLSENLSFKSQPLLIREKVPEEFNLPRIHEGAKFYPKNSEENVHRFF